MRMTENDFIKVLQKYKNPAIIVFINDEGELKMQTSADLELTLDMLKHAVDFLPSCTEVEVSSTETLFTSNTNIH